MKKLLWLIPLLGALSCASVGADDQSMKPYPAPQAGYQRFVIALEPQTGEAQLRIELLPGKMMTVDCNRVWQGGRIAEKIAQGWGYPYYVLETVGPPAVTKMACPPQQKTRELFVPVQTEQGLMKYNSKLPLVVYVPDGFEVRYRIWQGGELRHDAMPR